MGLFVFFLRSLSCLYILDANLSQDISSSDISLCPTGCLSFCCLFFFLCVGAFQLEAISLICFCLCCPDPHPLQLTFTVSLFWLQGRETLSSNEPEEIKGLIVQVSSEETKSSRGGGCRGTQTRCSELFHASLCSTDFHCLSVLGILRLLQTQSFQDLVLHCGPSWLFQILKAKAPSVFLLLIANTSFYMFLTGGLRRGPLMTQCIESIG